MSEILRRTFDTVLEASWQAAVIVAIVLLVDLLLWRRIAPCWRCAIWMLVFLRLLLPTIPSSPISVFNLARGPVDSAHTSLPPYGAVVYDDAPEAGTSLPNPSSTAPIEPREWRWPDFAPLLWLGVSACLLLRMVGSSVMLSRRLRRIPSTSDPALIQIAEACARELRTPAVRVVETDLVNTPAVAGIIRPMLLIPPGLLERMKPGAVRMVVLHELAHARCRDVAVGFVTAAITCVHWFNPLIWFAAARLRAERELACDAVALNRANPDERDAYGRTILMLLESFSSKNPHPAIAGMLQRRGAIRRRITAISDSSLSALPRFSLVGPLVLLLIGCATLTGPRQRAGDAADESVVTRVYDVRFLISQRSTPDFVADEHGWPAEPAKTAAPTRSEVARELITRITSTIDPPSWRSNTGSTGSIGEIAGQLIVTQKQANQRAVESLLAAIKRERGAQITVEARIIRSDAAEKLLYGDPGATADADGSPKIIDDAIVRDLLAGVTQDGASSVIRAPRITLFNGQRAFLIIGDETAYTKSYVQIDDRFDPVTDVVKSGMFVDATAMLSADRKYVTLRLRPQQTALEAIAVSRWPDSPPGQDLMIQTPQIAVAKLDTTITMPDGSWVVYRLRPERTPETRDLPRPGLLFVVHATAIVDPAINGQP